MAARGARRLGARSARGARPRAAAAGSPAPREAARKVEFEVMASVKRKKIYPRSILSTPGSSGYGIFFKQVLSSTQQTLQIGCLLTGIMKAKTAKKSCRARRGSGGPNHTRFMFALGAGTRARGNPVF